MTIWIFALILTAIVCATLYYAAAGRVVNAGPSTADAMTAQFRAQLREIDADVAAGELDAEAAVAAKGELAREVMRSKGEVAPMPARRQRLWFWLPIPVIAVLAFGMYAYLGRPDLPSAPLADRTPEPGQGLDLNTAIKTIETRLATNPNDLRGWQVIAPIYMQLGRFADAVTALRHVNALATPTADSETDLGEALMMQAGGSIVGEPMDLFSKAVALDPQNVRARYYIAGEETRTRDYTAAVRDWNDLLATAKGDEPWVVTAKNELAEAQAGLNPPATVANAMAATDAAAAVAETPATLPSASIPEDAQINAMVDGLEARLRSQGGTIGEWTELVRSRMVQGRMKDAQDDFDAARKAFPDPKVRTELNVLAADNGLVAR